VSDQLFRTELFLPAQAAAETEATIIKWNVAEGDSFSKGQLLAEVESAKSTFEFEAPCSGKVIRLMASEGGSVAFDAAVMEVETDDETMKESIPNVGIQEPGQSASKMEITHEEHGASSKNVPSQEISIIGIGSYLPDRVVKNAELLVEFPEISEDYIFGVTGIRQRHWARPDEKPSDMAYAASVKAIEQSGLSPQDIDAIVLSTHTPDAAMPATACILQQKLGIRGIPAFDINAACSGWLYALSTAKGLILSGLAENVLIASVDMQSRLLDKSDKNTYFLFGDGAGATVISGTRKGHIIRKEILIADSEGLNFARRRFPGYEVSTNFTDIDPWIRLDGRALFRFATESFSSIIKDLISSSGWDTSDVRWVVPHQANGRILKAAASKSGVSFDRFYLNIDRVGNTSSASIPIALSEIEKGLQKNDKIIFCTVGAGITAAGLSVEW
jgi:3-oxoacyl-[acyl-carrier-protein] synthase III